MRVESLNEDGDVRCVKDLDKTKGSASSQVVRKSDLAKQYQVLVAVFSVYRQYIRYCLRG